MSLRRTLILLIVAVALLVLYWKHPARRAAPILPPDRNHPETAASVSTQAIKPLLALAFGDRLTRFSLQDVVRAETLAFEQKGNAWRLVQPVVYPADPLMVDEWIALLSKVERKQSFPASGRDLKKYGLDEPSFKLCVQTQTASADRCLLFGREAPFQKAIYAKWEREAEVFLIVSDIVRAFQGKSLYDVRKKQIFPLVTKNADRILLESDGKRYLMSKQGTEWRMEEPAPRALVPDEIKKLLALLANVYVKEFRDAADSHDASFGLSDAPAVRLEVHGAGGERAALRLGSSVPGMDGYYAVLEKSSTVLIVSKSKINHLRAYLDLLAYPMKNSPLNQ